VQIIFQDILRPRRFAQDPQAGPLTPPRADVERLGVGYYVRVFQNPEGVL
jgi:hypothetical protein